MASESRTIKTFECTARHVNYPTHFLPIDTTNPKEKEKCVRFTVTELGPVCGIKQEPFKIGEIIAVCNGCLNAFLARTLVRSFINSKVTVCPICPYVLNKDEIKLTHLEKLRLQIDLHNENIDLREYHLEQRREELKTLSKNHQKDKRTLDKLWDPDDQSSSNEDPEIKQIVTESRIKDEILFENSKKTKEEEIDRFSCLINENKEILSKLLNEEKKIVEAQETKQFIQWRNEMTKKALVISAFALVFIASFKIIQYNFFCSFFND